jgi:hypothetical protein
MPDQCLVNFNILAPKIVSLQAETKTENCDFSKNKSSKYN